jgi:hypothetical protein
VDVVILLLSGFVDVVLDACTYAGTLFISFVFELVDVLWVRGRCSLVSSWMLSDVS